jgi:starch-binding outer membrane protein, SusD/RagB family
MKSKNIFKRLLHLQRLVCGIFLLLFLGTGCTKFVKVEPPKSQLLGELVFTEAGTAEAAMAGIYAQLREGYNSIFTGSSMGMTLYLALYADELISYDLMQQTHGPNFFKNTLFPDSDDLYTLWGTSYNQIYNVNAMLDGLARSTLLDTAVKAQLTGEALFVRGLVHFCLTNLFGDVPYAKTSDYLVNKSATRMPVKQVYQQVLTDLEMALERLPEDYPTAGRVRLNKSVARALMARVYLYDENWERAEELATELIHKGPYIPEQDLSKLFLKESTSTIWAFQPNAPGYNTAEAFTYIMLSSPMPYGRSMSPSQLNAFESGDLRATEWLGSYIEGTDTFHFPYKYKFRSNGGNIDYEYPIVLRIEEQYLIRAEARAHQEMFEEARQDIDVLRSRAGLSNSTAATLDDLLDAILHERQVELFVEYGHRFFDLKRMGKLDEILGAVKPNWDSHDAMLPIPEKELLANPNLLPQNQGYN